MYDQLKKKNPTVPASLSHRPVASTVLICLTNSPRRKGKKNQLKVSIVQIQRDGFAPEVVSYA